MKPHWIPLMLQLAIPLQALSDNTQDDPSADQLVRWAFCKTPETIEEGVRRLSLRPSIRTIMLLRF